MKINGKGIRLIAFLMTFFMLFGELNVCAYASTVDFSAISSVDETEDDSDAVVVEGATVDADDVISADTTEADTTDEKTNVDSDDESNVVDSDDEATEEIEAAENDEGQDSLVESEEEIVIEEQLEEAVLDENALEDVLTSTLLDKIVVKINKNSSVHAKVSYYAKAEDEIKEDKFALVTGTDDYADVINETVEDAVESYTFIKVDVDDQYELVADENGIVAIFINGESNLVQAVADKENVYKVSVVDIEELDICVTTQAIVYTANYENESEDIEALKAVFSNNLVENEEVIDIANEIASFTVEDSLYVKFPTGIVVEETAFKINYESISLYYGEETKDITEVLYECPEYLIYKIADAGEYKGDVTLKTVTSVAESELVEEDSVAEEELDAGTKRTVKVIWDDAYVSIEARIGSRGLMTAGTYMDDHRHIYYSVSVPDGESLVITAIPKKYSVVKGAYIQKSTKLTTSKTGEFTINPSDSLINEVEIIGGYSYEEYIYKSSFSDHLEKVGGVYKVDYDGSYTAGIVYGSNSNANSNVFDYKITAGTVDLTDKVAKKYSSVGPLSLELNKIDPAVIAGKTLVLTYKCETPDGIKSVTMKLAVSCPATSVAVTGAKFVNGVNRITVPVGVEKRFKVTTNDKSKVDYTRLQVYPSNSNYYFDASTGELVVNMTVKYVVNDIDFYFTYDEKRIEGEKFNFKIVPEVTSFTKLVPTVKVDSATDTHINLKLSLPKAYEDCSNIFYIIEAIAVGADKGPIADNMLAYTSKSISAATIGADGIYKFQVAENAVPGMGKAQKYSISVSMALVDNNNGIVTKAGDVEAISKFAKVSAATQNPYYDTKIAVKKINNSIMQGQQNLLMAKFANSAKTTYRGGFELVGIDGVYKKNSYFYTDVISVDENELANGNLVVSASKKALAVKDISYRIKVKAINAPDTMATVSEFVFNVKPAISRINVQTTSESLYKAYNKPATMTLNIKAFDYDGNEVKLNAKNVRYEIVDPQKRSLDDPAASSWLRQSVENKYISVANGKITIDKKYVLPFSSDLDKFRVKVTAIDCLDNEITAYSDEVVLASEAQTIAELRWVVAPTYDKDKDEYTGFSTVADPRYGQKSFELKTDNEKHDLDSVKGCLVALDQDGKVIRDVSFKISKGTFDQFYTIRDNLNGKYLFFRSQQYVTGSYTITASMNNGVKSSKTFSFSTKAGPATFYSIDSVGGYAEPYRTVNNTTYCNNYGYAPIVVGIRELNSGKYTKKLEIDGGTLIKTVSSGSNHYYYVLPNSENTIIYVKGTIWEYYEPWDWWYSYQGTCWTHIIYNDVYSSNQSVTASSGVNCSDSFYSSILTKPVDNTIYAGYISGNQKIKYQITSGYTYETGDEVAILLDPVMDGINNNANRKPLNSYLFGAGYYYDGWGRSVEIDSKGVFVVGPSYDNVLDSNTKPGEYIYYAVIHDKDGNVKSNPFKISINVMSIAKQSGDIKTAAIINQSTEKEVYFDWNTTKPNVSNLNIVKIMNANINGTPSDFTKYFTIEGGKIVLKSTAPKVTKDTKITGWITYAYYAPNGIVTNTKQVTITVKP